MQTGAQTGRIERLTTRNERLAIHTHNCRALEQAYVQQRGVNPRAIRYDIDAFLQAVTMERDLGEADFNPTEFLQRLSPTLRQRHRLF
jgi:hypothetical protein